MNPPPKKKFKKLFYVLISFTLIITKKSLSLNSKGCTNNTTLCCCFWGPAEMLGHDFDKNKVLLSIFLKFYSRNNLNKFDWLTSQDLYSGPSINIHEIWSRNNSNKLDWLTSQAVYNLSTCSFSRSIDLVEILTRLMIPHSSHYIKQMTAHGSILGRGKSFSALWVFSYYLLTTCSWH